MKKFELEERRARLVQELRSITERPEGQGGDLSEAQERKFTEAKAEVASLEKQIERQSFLDDQDRRAQGQPVGERRDRQERPEVRAGKFLQRVASVMTPGGRGVESRAYGLSEGVGADGGFAVPPEQSNLLLQPILEASPVLSLCRRVPTQTGAIQFPHVDESSRKDGSRGGGTLAYRVPEGGEITKSQPKFKLTTATASKLVVMIPATDELLADAPALGSVIPTLSRAELEFKATAEVISGSGTGGEMLGILNSPALVSVAKESGQPADTVAWENITAMWNRAWPRGRANSAWLVGPGVEAQLMTMAVRIKNVAGTENVGGVPVYMPAGGASAAPYGTLMGRPVIPCEQCPPVGDQGDIILADLSQYLLVERAGIDAQSSIHVRFEYAETLFRFIWRIGGQPIWAAPQTPYSGSVTVSPFVTLDSRA